MLKKLYGTLAPLVAVAFFIYLVVDTVARIFFDAPGDPLIPLMFMALIIMGSATFYQVTELAKRPPMIMVTPEDVQAEIDRQAELN